TLLPLPKTLARLHGERKGFREAGEWLAAHAGRDEEIVDPFSWSAYYAGRTFVAGGARQPTPDDYESRVRKGEPFAGYVILDASASKHDHLWYLIDPAKRLAEQGCEVKRFASGAGPRAGAVVVYRIDK